MPIQLIGTLHGSEIRGILRRKVKVYFSNSTSHCSLFITVSCEYVAELFICLTSILSCCQPKEPNIKNANNKTYSGYNTLTLYESSINYCSMNISEQISYDFLFERRVVKKLSQVNLGNSSADMFFSSTSISCQALASPPFLSCFIKHWNHCFNAVEVKVPINHMLCFNRKVISS
ncbi:hypothetical protein AVEN_79011-1 [Araneus ventricosus]|uniref:Uncharacterized protein n=1 Tax=Araneus ventricosus TaxID=182803 RepID=A0A4Y2VHW2_ARAVE|nr:hypothetical protein AVEN_79011-1 [Araneus ventricosus]